MRTIQTEFRTTLRAVLPALERISGEIGELRREVSGLSARIPSRTFIIGTGIALFAAFLAVADTQGFWKVVLEIVKADGGS